MAEKYWLGGDTGNEGDWSVAANWLLCSDDSATTVPAAGDVIHFDGRAALDATTGKRQSCDVNIDGAGTGAIDLGRLHIKETFDGDVGTASEYLEIEVVDDDIIFQGTGSLYLKLSAGVGADADCARFVCLAPSGTAYLASLENDASNVGLFGQVLAIEGRLYLDDSCALTHLVIASAAATVRGGVGLTDNKSVADVKITMAAGLAYWDSAIGTGSQFFAGTFNWGTGLAAAVGGLDSESIELYPGARFNWTTKDSAVSILKRFYNYGGVLDGSRALNSGSAKQLGSGSSEISEVWGKNGQVLLGGNNQNISLGSGSAIKTYGGKLSTPGLAEVVW